MTVRTIHSPSKDIHLDQITKELMRQANHAVTVSGEFQFAISESPTVDDVYARLMCDPDMRSFPWGKTQLWCYGQTTSEDSIQEALALHAGIPENQVNNVSEGLPEGISIDCCLTDGTDVEALPEDFKRVCQAWIIVSEKDVLDVQSDGVQHCFTFDEELD